MSLEREPCRNCGSTEPLYTVNGFLRCPGCFLTDPAPAAKEEDTVSDKRDKAKVPAPAPPKGKAKGKAVGGRQKGVK